MSTNERNSNIEAFAKIRERIRINFGKPEGRQRARGNPKTKLDKAEESGTGEEKRSKEFVGGFEMRSKNDGAS